MGHGVGVFEYLILLQVHLQRALVWKVLQLLLELNEVLHRGKSLLNAHERLLNGAFNGHQLANDSALLLVVRRVGVLLVIQVQMFGDTGLTERHLVRHAEGVDHGVVFIAK